MESNGKMPKLGDVIWVNCVAFHHCGIYAGDGKVVHFAFQENSGLTPIIHETTFENFKHGSPGDPWHVVDLPNVKYSPEETVARARSRLGEKGYNFVTNNCDHFATWCKVGDMKSEQADAIKEVLRASGYPALDFVAFIHDFAERSHSPDPEKRSTFVDFVVAWLGRANLDISEIAQIAVSVLAKSENPEIIIGRACNRAKVKARGKYHTMRGERHWDPIAEDNGWLVQRNHIFRQYRLIGPEPANTHYASALTSIMTKFFEEVITEVK